MGLIDLLLFLQSAAILLVFFMIAWLRRDRESPRGSLPLVGKCVSRLHLWGDLLTVTSEPVRVVPCLMRCREEAQ